MCAVAHFPKTHFLRSESRASATFVCVCVQQAISARMSILNELADDYTEDEKLMVAPVRVPAVARAPLVRGDFVAPPVPMAVPDPRFHAADRAEKIKAVLGVFLLEKKHAIINAAGPATIARRYAIGMTRLLDTRYLEWIGVLEKMHVDGVTNGRLEFRGSAIRADIRRFPVVDPGFALPGELPRIDYTHWAAKILEDEEFKGVVKVRGWTGYDIGASEVDNVMRLANLSPEFAARMREKGPFLSPMVPNELIPSEEEAGAFTLPPPRVVPVRAAPVVDVFRDMPMLPVAPPIPIPSIPVAAGPLVLPVIAGPLVLSVDRPVEVVPPIPVRPLMSTEARKARSEGKREIGELAHNQSADAAMEGAARMVGSRAVVGKGKKMHLKHNLSATDGQAWSQICGREAAVWTARLRAGVAEGTVKESDYDGHEITNEEWNDGGHTPYTKKRIGPERRSNYQYFSRSQRARVQKILYDYVMKPASKKQLDVRVRKASRELAREDKKIARERRKQALVTELGVGTEGAPKSVRKRKRKTNKDLVAEFDVDVEEVVAPQTVGVWEEKLGDAWANAPDPDDTESSEMGTTEEDTEKFMCEGCGGERDEFSQLCPTCMRAGIVGAVSLPVDEPGPSQDEPPLAAVYPHDQMDVTKRALLVLDAAERAGKMFFFPPDLFLMLTSWYKVQGNIKNRRHFSRRLLLSMVEVGCFINRHIMPQKDPVRTMGTFCTRSLLRADIWDLASILFSNIKDWNVSAPPSWIDDMGLKTETIDQWKGNGLVLDVGVRGFLTGAVREWPGGERVALSAGHFHGLRDGVIWLHRVMELSHLLVRLVMLAAYDEESPMRGEYPLMFDLKGTDLEREWVEMGNVLGFGDTWSMDSVVGTIADEFAKSLTLFFEEKGGGDLFF